MSVTVHLLGRTTDNRDASELLKEAAARIEALRRRADQADHGASCEDVE